ncbi:MAG: glycosyltransferase family 39 protein [Candidatus Moraniibacteriota bacterium]
MPPLLIVFLGFSLATVAVWLRYHFFILPDDWLAVGLPLFVYGFFAGLAGLWFSIWNRVFTVRWPRLVFPGIVFMLAIGIFNVQAFLIGFLPEHEPILPLTSWFSANLSFIAKLGTIVMAFTLLTIIFAMTGNLIIRRFIQIDDQTGYWFFVRLAVGLSLWVSFLIALSALHILSPAAIWLIVTLMAFREWRYLVTLMRWCLRCDTWSIDIKNHLLIMMTIGVFLFALNIAEAIRPDPVGYDDMTYYMSRANLMAEKATLIPGGNPFPFELLAAGIRIASADDTMLLALSLGVYGLFLGIAVLFAFGRSVFNARVGIIAATIMLSLPIGPALAIAETKPDALLFPITTLFFWSLLRWLQTTNIRNFYFSLFLFGFALSIKLTALFLSGPLLVSLLLFFTTTRPRQPIPSIRHGLLAGLLFVLPLLPWIWYGASTQPGIRFSAPLQNIADSSAPTLHHDIEEVLGSISCSSTASIEDFARFHSSRGPIAGLFFLPWDLTMNLTVTAFAAEIGIIFLAILPIWVTSVYPFRKYLLPTIRKQPAFHITLLALSYALLWIIFAERIPWYGYPGLALLTLLAAHTIEQFRSPRFLGYFLVAILITGLIGNSLVRMKFSGASGHLQYAGGLINAEEFLNATFPGLITLKSAFNTNPNVRVYVTGSRLWYAIENKTDRAYMDSHLDTFDCLLRTYGTDGTLEKFQALDIRYVFFSRTLLQELKSEKNPTFHAKVERFTDFAGKYLRVVWGSPYYMLFEVPSIR